MWIVRLALERRYTFIVMAILIMIATPLAIMRTAVDALPDINIPVVSIIWNYSGLSSEQMALKLTQINERNLTTIVNDIEHVESQSYAGIAIIKVYFQPNVNIDLAVSQVVAISQAILRNMPPGVQPPLVIKFTASSIPVLQVGLSSKELPDEKLNDVALNIIRPQLVTIPGVAIPYPFGGKTRLVSVDINPQALIAKGLVPADVINAISTQNLTLPSGTVKFGDSEYTVGLNASPDKILGLNDIPVKTQNGATTYLKEIAHVRDGFSPQTNIVHQDGQPGVLISIQKNGAASTLSVVSALKAKLPGVMDLAPPSVEYKYLLDQSIFVRAAIFSVIHEALIAATLTAIMLLLFLGNWRTSAIIAISIPLSIFTSVVTLNVIGETLNIMTLGGLALAVGILVDDATVTIENIERHLHMGKDLYNSILDGAGEIAVPAFVSTICICIVFVPMFFLQGVAKFLFVPLAEAVIFAMIASYILSRTLVPTLAIMMLAKSNNEGVISRFISRVNRQFNEKFEQFRMGYALILHSFIDHRREFASLFLGFCVLSFGLFFVLGRDLFPQVDSGQIKLHMRAPSGTRIEKTSLIVAEVREAVKEIVPPEELDTIIDNIGLPYSGINLSYSNSGVIGPIDADILISLKENHRPSNYYVEKLIPELSKRFPGNEFYNLPSDVVTQILNFGVPSAIDVQVIGKDLKANARIAASIRNKTINIPGAVDVHVQERGDLPVIKMNMDRSKLQNVGLSASDVAQGILLPLAGSTSTTPIFWLNPINQINYTVALQTPQYKIKSMNDLMQLPVGNASSNVVAQKSIGSPQMLGNLVTAVPETEFAMISHYDSLAVVNVYINARGRDLGSVAKDVQKVIDEESANLPKGTKIVMRGQVNTMKVSYQGLVIGILGAMVLVYLLIVVNFQSWIDPFIIISALPAALAGIGWMLLLTGTNLSVPALTGAIMTMGVATANSILVVSFAKQKLEEGMAPLAAALEAGQTRLRPVIMTATAMILGMIPMAIGLGEGSEQNAPLGRAVIGGLLFATVSTLFFVPVVFGAIHNRIANKKININNGLNT
jgi:multidrug efflux pump subunit AcrB